MDGRTFGVVSVALCAGFLWLAPTAFAAPQADQPAAPANGTIAYVLAGWKPGIYTTADAKEECPNGLNSTYLENYQARFPSEDERRTHQLKYSYYVNGGPNGENVYYNPETVTDPLPFHELMGKKGYGLNLDGKVGPNDFTSPDGETGIDNQLARVLGCTAGWRSNGLLLVQDERRLRDNTFNRLIFVISGVKDLQNSDNVTVTTYRGLDTLSLDAQFKVIPGSTQRIDYKYGQRYIQTLKGKIVAGVLMTEPTDFVMPWSIGGVNGGFYTDERPIRGMRLRLKISPDAADGLMAGYLNVASWWSTYIKRTSGTIGDIVRGSPSSVYAALHRLADAYPDPATGKNTAISNADLVELTRVEVSNLPRLGTPSRVAIAPR